MKKYVFQFDTYRYNMNKLCTEMQTTQMRCCICSIIYHLKRSNKNLNHFLTKFYTSTMFVNWFMIKYTKTYAFPQVLYSMCQNVKKLLGRYIQFRVTFFSQSLSIQYDIIYEYLTHGMPTSVYILGTHIVGIQLP